MAFSIEQFHDLIRLLEQHPEWRAELRRVVLSDDLLELPAITRRLAEAQERTQEQIQALTVRMDQLAERMDQLAERMDQLTARMDQLAERMDQLTARMDQLAERMDQLADAQRLTEGRVGRLEERMQGVETRLEGVETRLERVEIRLDGVETRLVHVETKLERVDTRVGRLEGDSLERRYRELAPAYFGRLVRRLRLVERTALADELDAAVERGVLTPAEREAVLLADVLATGRRPEDQADVYLLAEVSAGVGPDDVQRAAERSAALAKLGRPVIPIVAGESITADAAPLAKQQGVWQVLDGRTIPPSES